MRRPIRLLLSAALAAAPAVGVLTPLLPATPAEASAVNVDSVRLNGFEAKLVAAINNARRNAGLRTLEVVAGMTDVARRWSWQMAGGEELWHNPSLVSDIEHSGAGAWTMVAENVGYGGSGDPGVLFSAYMNSPAHRANILDSQARFLGIGVVERDGLAWNTMDFVNAYSTNYGRTRVPAAGLTMDKTRITSTTDVAIFEGNADQRFGTRHNGGVVASRIGFTGPTSGNDAAYTVLHKPGGNGSGSVLMRDALDLSSANSLSLQLSAGNREGRKIPVTVQVRRSFGNTVTLGTVHVGGRSRWVELPLTSGARSFEDTVVLKVTGKAVAAAGGRVRLAIRDVRVAV